MYGNWIDVDSHLEKVPTEEISNANLNPQTLKKAGIGNVEEENNKWPPSNKDIVAVQHRADEKSFEQHYSYESMVIKLLNAKKKRHW